MKIKIAPTDLVILFATLAGTGCGTTIHGLRQSSAFTYDAILSGKMAVGGVTSATEKLEESKQATYGNALRTQVLDLRKDYSVAPVGAVMSHLGRAKYEGVLGELKTTGSLSDPSVKLLAGKVKDSRFVAFARIENDDVQSDKSETSTSDSKGQPIPGTQKINAWSRRTVTATISIYDLKRLEVAWSGQITKTGQNQLQYQKHKEAEAVSSVISVIKAVKGTDDKPAADVYPCPPPPATAAVLGDLFGGFADNLPKKK